MVFKCPICGREDFQSERGLSIHISRKHPCSSDGKGSRPPTGTNDRRDERDRGAMVFKCPICKREDFQSERGLSIHISKKHTCSTDGKGSRPPTGTNGRRDERDSGAMVFKCPICKRDDFKSERGLNYHVNIKHPESADGKGSQPSWCTNGKWDGGARPKTHTAGLKGHGRHSRNRDIVEGVAMVVQKDSFQKASPGEFLFKDGTAGAGPRSNPARHHDSPKQDRISADSHDRPSSSASNFSLSCNAQNFEKYVAMIEGSIIRPREDSTFRTENVNMFIDDLKVVMERRSNIPIKLLKSGSYYDRTKIDYNDEFDFMFYPDIRMEADFSKCPPGYCKIRKGKTESKDLDPFIDKNGYLVPDLYKKHMFDIFEKCRTDPSFRKGRRTQMKPRKPESPAYTLLFDLGIPDKTPIDIDLVPAVRIDGWPITAREIRSGQWIEESTAKRAMQCFHVVTKKFPGDHPDIDLLWRVSFSHAEKELILHANQTDKGCRKDVFKILKKIKENMKSKNTEDMDKFCSYHLKMFILGFYDRNEDFRKEKKIDLLKDSIKQLAKCIRKGTINNYFINRDNVLQSVPDEERRYVVGELEALLT